MNETRKKIAELLIANEKLSSIQKLSYNQIADQCGATYGQVSSLAHQLRAKGELKHKLGRRVRTDGSNRGATRNPIPAEARDPEAAQILREIEHKEFIDSDDRRKVLSLLIKASTDDVRVRAISLLESIESAQERSLGPPPPTTHEERVDRLASLMSAVGKKVVNDALAKAVYEEIIPQAYLKQPETGDSNLAGRGSESGG